MVNSEKKLTSSTTGKNVARYLIDIGAINFRPTDPYILTAGWASPVYIDCRKLISYPKERHKMMELAVAMLDDKIDLQISDSVIVKVIKSTVQSHLNQSNTKK